jgi:CBS domain-containing protein
MSEPSVRQFCSYVEPLAPTDTAGRAVELVRRSANGTAPVVAGDEVVGLVSEAELLRLIAPDSTGGATAASEAIRTQPVAGLMSLEVLLLPDWYSLRQAAALMQSRSLEAVPVVTETGAYCGMLSRRTLIEALANTLRPVSVGGMATPLGVYLSTGHHRAGAGDLGLFLTGAAMFALMSLGHWALFAGIWSLDELTGSHFSEIYLSPALASFRGVPALTWVFELLVTAVFLLLIRAAPLSGYHAAEHQVVHAMERGDRLEREVVRGMPRPHPRCGTNLAALLMLFFLIADRTRSLLIAVALTLPFWRILGMHLQQYFTTKPASDKQLDNGMRAGAEILAKYHQNAAYQAPWWQRVWYMGMLQVIAGAAAVWGIGWLAGRWIDLGAFL